MEFRWNKLKDKRLRMTRGVSFKEILSEKLIRVIDNPAIAGQYLILMDRKGYVWVVPFVHEGGKFFLKTLYPCRKYTKLYRKGEI